MRDAMRERLAALGACSTKYKIHVDIRQEPLPTARTRIQLFLVVYSKDGALAGEIPTILSGNTPVAADVAGAEALLRASAEQGAEVYSHNFH